MKLINPSGILAVPGTVPTGNLVWVDAASGNDSLVRRGCLTIPFKTLTAAKNAAASGDTIVVMPGTYNESNLLKNGVNWHFLTGAKVNASSGIVFDASAGGITSIVSGWGEFSGPGEIVKSSGSTLTVEALNLTATSGTCIRCSGSTGKVHVKALGQISATSGVAIDVDGSASNHVIEAYAIIASGYALSGRRWRSPCPDAPT